MDLQWQEDRDRRQTGSLYNQILKFRFTCKTELSVWVWISLGVLLICRRGGGLLQVCAQRPIVSQSVRADQVSHLNEDTSNKEMITLLKVLLTVMSFCTH